MLCASVGPLRSMLQPKEKPMRKFIFAGMLVLCVTPALAFVNLYFVAVDTKTGHCVMMTHAPTGSRYKMMGKFETKAAARTAMHSMAECH